MQIANWWVIECKAPKRLMWHVVTNQHLRAVGSQIKGGIRTPMSPKSLDFCSKWFVGLAQWSETEGKDVPYDLSVELGISDISGYSLRIRNLHSDETIPMEAFAMSPAILT